MDRKKQELVGISVSEWIYDIPSTTEVGVFYNIEINIEEQIVRCECKGFQVHKRCKHIRFYKHLIKEILK